MKIQVNKQNVGLRIKQLRQDKGYTLEEFGKLLGDYQANKATVLGWENGRSLPNKERIKAIAKLGEMSVNELLYGSVEEFLLENYYQISTYHGLLAEHQFEDVEKFQGIPFININTITEIANENNITVNELEKLIHIADNIINSSVESSVNMFNNLCTLLKKLDDEHLEEIFYLLCNKLEDYTITSNEEKIIESIKLYFIKDSLNTNPSKVIEAASKIIKKLPTNNNSE